MKKFLFFIFIIPCLAFSQDKKVSFGVKAGYALTNLRGYDLIENNLKSGFIIGGLVNYKLGNTFSLQPEILFSTKGFSSETILTDKNGNPILDSKFKLLLNYIEVPVLVKATFGEEVQPYLLVGPAPAYLLSGKSKLVGWFSEDQTNILNRFDLGVLGGAGVEFPLTERTRFLAEIRYNFGLINIVDTIDGYNNAFGLLAGLKF